MSKPDLLLNIGKASIIVFLSISLFGNFFPFFDYPNDSHVYGVEAIRFYSGSYEYTSSLLQSTGKWEFVPHDWVKTINNGAIPNIMPGLSAIGAFFYSVGGNYGLFYLGPIFTILLYIFSERMSTYFFGKYVGFLTLVFLATNEFVFWVGRALLTDNIFALLFMLGCFYLTRFLHNKIHRDLLFSSVFFSVASFIRLNGILLLPLEILLIVGYFTYHLIRLREKKSVDIYNKNSTFTSLKFNRKQAARLSICIGVPWGLFFMFFIFFNMHYFGDPQINVYNVPDNPRKIVAVDSEIFNLDPERVKKYLNHFVIYPFNRLDDVIQNKEEISERVNDSIGKTLLDFTVKAGFLESISLWLSVPILLLIIGSISIRYKINRTEVFLFIIFIIGFIAFYSTNFIAFGRQGSGRDMLPVFPLFYMLLSLLIVRLINANTQKRANGRMLFKSFKLILVLALVVYIPFSFYYADYSQLLKNQKFKIINHADDLHEFPPSLDDIPHDSVIVTAFDSNSVIAYGAIPFSPIGLEKQINQNSPVYLGMIDTLKKTIENDYDVYVFKEPHLQMEKDFNVDLVNNHGFILKDHSKKFCKLEIGTTHEVSDQECLEKN